MMRFLQTRNFLMEELGWTRRVATLATRLAFGVDTWEGIEATPTFLRRPLLFEDEKVRIRTIGLKLIREAIQ